MARHTGGGVGSFALWRPHKERPRAQLFAYDAQQLGASSTALWQPGLVPVPENNLESKKLADLDTVNTLAQEPRALIRRRPECKLGGDDGEGGKLRRTPCKASNASRRREK